MDDVMDDVMDQAMDDVMDQAMDSTVRSHGTGASRRTSLARRLAGGIALATAVGLATPAFAETPEPDSPRREMARKAGMGIASALASIVYAPAKIAYAAGGIVVGGLAYAFSAGDREVAETVITPAVRGDYVVTPSQLKRETKVEFIGRDPNYRQSEPPDSYLSEPPGSYSSEPPDSYLSEPPDVAAAPEPAFDEW